MGGKSDNKAAYFDKLKALLDEFKSIFIVGVDKYVLPRACRGLLRNPSNALPVSRPSRCTRSVPRSVVMPSS